MKGIRRKILILCILLLTAAAGCGAAEEDAPGRNVRHKEIQQETSGNTQESTAAPGSTAAPERTPCPEFEGEDVRNVRVEAGDEILWEIDYVPQEDRGSYLFWDMKAPYHSCAVVDTESMFRIYNRIASLDFHKKAEPADVRAAGLESPGRTVTLDYYQGDQKAAPDGTKPMPNKTFTLLIGRENGKGQYFCTLKGYEEEVLLLDQSVLDEVFAKNPYDLILKIPYVVDISTVSEVRIQSGDREYTMKSRDGGYMLGKKKVDQKKYSEVYQALMQPMIAQELKEESSPGRDRQPVLSLEYKRSGEQADDLEVCFYQYDESYDSVSVNGNEFFLVSSQEVQQLQDTLEDCFQ